MKNFVINTKRFVSAICIITLLLSMATIFAFKTSAASVNQKFDCDKTVTFVVKTNSKGKASVKFECDAFKDSRHKCTRAPLMAISVSPAIDGEDFFLIKGTGKNISSTLKLKPNTTYNVRVSYYVNKANKCTCSNLNMVSYHDLGISTRYGGYNGRDIYVNGSWHIAKTSNCTVSNIRIR